MSSRSLRWCCCLHREGWCPVAHGPLAWESCWRGSKLHSYIQWHRTLRLYDSCSQSLKAISYLLYPRKIKTTWFFHGSPWSRLRNTINLQLLLTHQCTALLSTGISYTCFPAASGYWLLLSISQLQRSYTHKLSQGQTWRVISNLKVGFLMM